MDSESSKSAFNGIMEALNSHGVNMIGLYGMPGVGKTTLVEVVGKQAREEKLFDKVVIVTVFQTPNINKIQHRIAETFGLKFAASIEKGKPEELLKRLKGEEKFLIIVDDIWKEFKLQTIGISFSGEHEGCKILITTRLQQVCSQMNCQKEFKLNVLSEDEAWALFKDNAGLKDASPTLNDVAKEVALECKGLPLAIVTMGKALKDETPDGRVVNQRLKNSRHIEDQDICEDDLLERVVPWLVSVWVLAKVGKLTIEGCDDLIVAVPCLQNLKEVSIEECMGLEVAFQIHGLLHANEKNQTSLLSSLTKLELFSLPELKCIWKGPPHLV